MILNWVSSILAGLCAVLAAIYVFAVGGNANQRAEAAEFQSFIESQHLELGQKRQQLQAQQQMIDKGSAISGTVGPAVIKDIAELALKNGNPRLTALLQKYGVQARSVPAPAPAASPKQGGAASSQGNTEPSRKGGGN